MIGLVGKKVGMTRIFTEDGVSIPVTVIEVEANRVTQVKDLANSLSHRVPGSIGQNQTPGKVFKGKKMAGQMGNERVTVQSLDVVRVDAERNLLLVKGAVPGATGSDLIVKPAVKA